MLAGSYGLCVIALLGMKLTKPDNTLALMFWDASQHEVKFMDQLKPFYFKTPDKK